MIRPRTNAEIKVANECRVRDSFSENAFWMAFMEVVSVAVAAPTPRVEW